MTSPDITIGGIDAKHVGPEELPTFTRGDEETVEFAFSAAAHDDAMEWLAFDPDAMVRRGTTDRGVPWFRERIAEMAPIETLIASLEVADDEYRDVWALIVGGENLANTNHLDRRLELDLFVLAPLDEHADAADVRQAYGDELAINP